MTTVAQLLRHVFKEKNYDIEVIECTGDDVDPMNFEPLYGKLKFKCGEKMLNGIGTNADDKNPHDHDRNDVAEIAAALLQEIEYTLVDEFLKENKPVKTPRLAKPNNVMQLIEDRFYDRGYSDINVNIERTDDDVNILKFSIGTYVFDVTAKNFALDIITPYYKGRDISNKKIWNTMVVEVAAAAVEELEYEMRHNFLNKNKKV